MNWINLNETILKKKLDSGGSIKWSSETHAEIRQQIPKGIANGAWSVPPQKHIRTT